MDAYRYYVMIGAVSVPLSQLSTVDGMLRRSAWRVKHGLAEHYDHDALMARTVARPCDGLGGAFGGATMEAGT